MTVIALAPFLAGCSLAVAAAGGYNVPDPVPKTGPLGCEYGGPPTADAFTAILMGAISAGAIAVPADREGASPRGLGVALAVGVVLPAVASAVLGFHLLARCHAAVAP